jgi:hypothetical protein
MKATAFLTVILLSGCATNPAGFRYGHSYEPINLGGDRFLVKGYTLEKGLERAREFCGNKEMITLSLMRPLDQYEWDKITFYCK